jgi:hypothetical protein
MSQRVDLVLSGWDAFREQVIPDTMTDAQVREFRRTFYAGAHCTLTNILTALSAGKDLTDEDLMVMEHLRDELNRFALDVVAGKD